MNQQEALVSAKQGDRQAIAALMNKALRPKGITARVGQKNDCLQIFLETEQPSNQQALTAFIAKGVASLEIPGVHNLAIYGRRKGQQTVEWTQFIQINPVQPSEKLEIANNVSVNDAVNPAKDVEEKDQKPLISIPILVALTSLAAVILFLPVPIVGTLNVGAASGLTFRAAKKGHKKLIRTWCNWFLVGFGMAIVLGFAKVSFFPSKPIDTQTANPSSELEPSPDVSPSPESVMPATPLPIAKSGIGISKQALQSKFEGQGANFTFEESSPVNGEPRVMGKAPNNLAYIELIGPSSDLSSAAIMAGMPEDKPDEAKLNALFLLLLLKEVAPQWDGREQWLTESMQEVAKTGEDVNTTVGKNNFRLQLLHELGILVLTVKPADS